MANRFPAFVIPTATAIVSISLALFLLPYRSFGALDRVAGERNDLVILSEGPLEPIAAHLREIYPGLKNDVEDTLGWRFQLEPVVRLIGSKDIFDKMSGSPHYSALAVPSKNLIVMFVSPVSTKSLVLSETFKHELCHLLLHDHIRDSLLPKWLDEGVCQWVSGSLGEILSGGGFPDTEMALARSPIPLRQLTYAFPTEKDSMALAYEESRRFVEYLTEAYGRNSLLAVLEHLREGNDIDRAISEVLSKSLETVEQEWLDGIRSRIVWLIWAGRHLYDILFALAALLTVLAFISLVVRRKRYGEEEEDEEEDDDE